MPGAGPEIFFETFQHFLTNFQNCDAALAADVMTLFLFGAELAVSAECRGWEAELTCLVGLASEYSGGSEGLPLGVQDIINAEPMAQQTLCVNATKLNRAQLCPADSMNSRLACVVGSIAIDHHWHKIGYAIRHQLGINIIEQ